MSRLIDLMHLGRDRVIGAYEIDGAVVDPGPSSCVDALLDGLDGPPRALLLTHIHLDHAGATGVLVRRFPELRVYVHERGAPHLIDPGKLLESASQLYGDDMDRLWGEVAPVPEGNVTALTGGETVEGFGVADAPGHASHHVAYLHEATGDAYVGDVGGVRVPPSDFTLAPSPPPDIDVEAWSESLDTVGAWDPARLCLTHFGRADDPAAQLERVRESLRRHAERARGGDESSFVEALEQDLAANVDPDSAARLRQAAPPEQLWLGLERYWRKRGERRTTAEQAGSAR
ncbi:MAG TPA: MBL fold metallo-hydrolase [Thermoleophilaceae bacterium]|nr:MBL fold metallo-hydrolase [Thermoleophilaceae bacterium]